MRTLALAVVVALVTVATATPAASATHWNCDADREAGVGTVGAEVYTDECTGAAVHADGFTCLPQRESPVHVLAGDGCHTGAAFG